MEAVAARVWIADARPAVALARALPGGDDDMAAAIRAHPGSALGMYAAMTPLAWNAPAERAYGLPQRHPADLLVNVPLEQLTQLVDALARVLGGSPGGVLEFRARESEGSAIATRFSWQVVGPPDDPLAEVIMTSLDRADLVSEQALRRARRDQLRAALRDSNTSVFMFDADMRVEWVENARTRPGFDFRGLDPVQCFGPDAGATVADLFRRVLDEGVEGTADMVITRDGVTRYFDFTARPWRSATGLITGIVGTNTDVTERERLLRDLATAAVTDGLTGLINRQGLARELDARAAGGRGDGIGALIAFDIPGFQSVNDVYGHEVGDDCLRAVADILTANAPAGSVVSRFTGDQFAVLLPDEAGGPIDVEHEAMRLRDLVASLRVPAGDGIEVRLDAVVGIAPARAAAGAPAASGLLGDVDIALARAKRTRGAVALIEADAESHRAAVRQRREWGLRVRDALEQDSLGVYAQPIVDLASGRPRAFELLARLNVDGEIVEASRFMPDIHLLGMAPLIDRWMVRRALALADGHASVVGDRHIAVNVGARTLLEDDLLGLLDEADAVFPGAISRLAIEITETEPLADLRAARHVVRGIRERGALFVLDDFGTGSATPEYLDALDVDWLKLDGSFVLRAAAGSRADRAVIAGAVAVADEMGIPVVAEWVEDASAVGLMRELGVAFGQGYHFGRPAEAEQVLRA